MNMGTKSMTYALLAQYFHQSIIYKDLSIHQLFNQHLCVLPNMSMKMSKNTQV